MEEETDMSTAADVLISSIKQNQRVLLSSDKHPLSQKLIKSITKLFHEQKVVVTVSGTSTSTAMLAYLVVNLEQFDVGVMVSCDRVQEGVCVVKVLSKQGTLRNKIDIEVVNLRDEAVKGKVLQQSEISQSVALYRTHVSIQAPLDPAISINRRLPIVITTMHGAGGELLPPVLNELGYSGVMFVPEEEHADGQFASSDPRDPTALAEGMRYLRGSKSGMLLAIDPAGERLTVTVRDNARQYRLLTSPEVATLMADYLCMCRSENGILSKHAALIETNGTHLASIAKSYGIKHQVVNADFTAIGAQLLKNKRGFIKHPLLMATDGQDGYLVGQYVNYRDALSAAVVMCEMYCYYESTPGVGMVDRLAELML